MSTNTFTVLGMTCSSCAMTVTEEVQEIPGVQDVVVELATGKLTVTAEPDLDPVRVKTAVEDAGYRLAAS
jgi:copper chaperone